MAKYVTYKPNPIPEGYRIEKVKCHKCYGQKYYSGKYGMTACEDCNNGYGYLLIKTRKKRKSN